MNVLVPAFVVTHVLGTICKLFPNDVCLHFLNHGIGFDQCILNFGMRTRVHIPRDLCVHYEVGSGGVYRFGARVLSDVLRGIRSPGDTFLRFVHEHNANILHLVVITSASDHSSHEIPLLAVPFEPSEGEQNYRSALKSIIDTPLLRPASYWFPLSKLRASLLHVRSFTDRLNPPPISLKRNTYDATEFEISTPQDASFSSHSFKLHSFNTNIVASDISHTFTLPFEGYFWPLYVLNGNITKHHARITMNEAGGGHVVHISIHLDWNLTIIISFAHKDNLVDVRRHLATQDIILKLREEEPPETT